MEESTYLEVNSERGDLLRKTEEVDGGVEKTRFEFGFKVNLARARVISGSETHEVEK